MRNNALKKQSFLPNWAEKLEQSLQKLHDLREAWMPFTDQVDVANFDDHVLKDIGLHNKGISKIDDTAHDHFLRIVEERRAMSGGINGL